MWSGNYHMTFFKVNLKKYMYLNVLGINFIIYNAVDVLAIIH